MFDISLLRYNPETPSFYIILITAIFAFFLSSLIAITYDYTTQSIYRRAHFLQGLALIGIVAATIMQAIGDSVAIGLGMLGALSIIRFRTILDDPRNITFMFASLAAGIAVGVLGYAIALTGTVVFCLAAIALRFSPLSQANELIGELKLQAPKTDHHQALVERQLKKSCKNFELNSLRFLNSRKRRTMDEAGALVEDELMRDNLQAFTYLIRLNKSATVTQMVDQLEEVEGVKNVRISFQKQNTKL
jgi:uncharacterized membrane protein YhiD involved in acid resistance